MQNRLTAADDVIEFTTRLEKEYEDTCLLMGIDELDLPFKEVLEVAITANMNLEGKTMFGHAIRRDAEGAIDKIEEAFQEKSFKDWIFRPKVKKGPSEKSYPSSPKPNPSYQKPCRNQNSYHSHRSRFNAFASRFYYNSKRYYPDNYKYWNWRYKPFEPARCWFYDRQGGCRYGDFCYYMHFKTDRHYEGSHGRGIPNFRESMPYRI